MKRSTVNETVEDAKEAFASVGFTLPPFAFWTVEDWQSIGPGCDDWKDNCWLKPCDRFCKTEEDNLVRHYLVHKYPASLSR